MSGSGQELLPNHSDDGSIGPRKIGPLRLLSLDCNVLGHASVRRSLYAITVDRFESVRIAVGPCSSKGLPETRPDWLTSWKLSQSGKEFASA